MGKVYTTSEDLTSVANAIRAKGGTNSSLVYPSGFVSAIGNIQGDVWDGIGANPEFVQTLWSENITLADTDWDNFTISASTQTLRNATLVINSSENTNVILNWDYDYLIRGEGIINIQYNETLENKVLSTYLLKEYCLTTYNNSIDAIQQNSQNYTLIDTFNDIGYTIYQKQNNIKIMASASCLYYTSSLFPNCSKGSGITSLHSPKINAYTDSSYFTQDIVSKINKNTTSLNFTWKLYRYTKHSTRIGKGSIYRENHFLTDYPQYAPQQS